MYCEYVAVFVLKSSLISLFNIFRENAIQAMFIKVAASIIDKFVSAKVLNKKEKILTNIGYSGKNAGRLRLVSI
jgi:hypothetical protein